MMRIAAPPTRTLIAPPIKTTQGKEELSSRTRKLSQRHRTLLLLIDGRRSRETVLAMAAQAGVQPALFDELVAMGLVDSQVEPEPEPQAEPAPAPVDEAASAAMAEPVDSAASDDGFGEGSAAMPLVVESPHPPPAPAHEAPGPAAELPPVESLVPAPGAASAQPQPAATAVSLPAPSPSKVARRSMASRAVLGEESPTPPVVAEPDGTDPPLMPIPPAPDWLPVASAPMPLVDTPRPEAPARAARVRFAAAKYPSTLPEAPRAAGSTFGAAPEPPPRPEPDSEVEDELRVLSEVRGLLIGTLLVDAPVSTSLTALRVGRARGHADLVALVWEIEASLARAQIPREGISRLMKARELLGLGNTQVQEDTGARTPLRMTTSFP